MENEVQYCLNVLLRIDGYDCDICGKRGTLERRKICDEVEKLI